MKQSEHDLLKYECCVLAIWKKTTPWPFGKKTTPQRYIAIDIIAKLFFIKKKVKKKSGQVKWIDTKDLLYISRSEYPYNM